MRAVFIVVVFPPFPWRFYYDCGNINAIM